MDLKAYLEKQRELKNRQFKPREVCLSCSRSKNNCYCGSIQKFDSKIKFVILIHPLEVRRRIATGRMSHMCLENSELIKGQDYSQNEMVTSLVQDPNFYPVILYPSLDSLNLSSCSIEERRGFFPKNKKLMIFVIDGTWNTANKMARSKNLIHLPKICFSPDKPSNFRVRKQPAPECYSTLEAIHKTIELVGEDQGFNLATREHDRLLYAFNVMVERQLTYVKKAHSRHVKKVS